VIKAMQKLKKFRNVFIKNFENKNTKTIIIINKTLLLS